MKTNLKVGTDGKTAAANIRAELRELFPGTKFSVRCDGSRTVYVRWYDGPTVDAVKTTTCKYENGSFDSSTDCYNLDRSDFNRQHGGADYVFCDRDFTPAAIDSAIVDVAKFYGIEAPLPTSAEWFNGSLLGPLPARQRRAIRFLGIVDSAPVERRTLNTTRAGGSWRA